RGADRRLRREAEGEVDDGRGARSGGVLEVDVDVVPDGEVAGDVVAQVLGGSDGERFGARETFVRLGDLGGGHADAGVDDGDAVAGWVVEATDLDDLVGGRVQQRVVDQLGQQVCQVEGDVAQHGEGIHDRQPDPLVLLDLAQRGPHAVD